MLPSMPILNINSRNSRDAPVDSLNEGVTLKDQLEVEKPLEKTSQLVNDEVKQFPLRPVEGKDYDDEVIFVNTLDKRKLKSGPGSSSLPKKKKKSHHNIDDEGKPAFSLEYAESGFAEAYFLKAMKTVDRETFEQFISYLLEYEVSKGNRVELFKRTEKLFCSFPDLIDGFLGFLQPHEAVECLKLREKNFITEAWNLFKYIEPSQMSKLITILEQHVDNMNMSVDEIKELIDSLFKSQPQIAVAISSLFLNGPPSIRDDETYEKVPSLSLEGGAHEYEAVNIPLQSVRDCTACLCPCHAEREALCAACHITVFNSKIYVKKDKVLRAAKIEFDGYSTSEILKKLNPEYFARKEALEMMASSPSKVLLKGERKERKSISESELKKSDSEDCESTKSEVPKELVHKVIFEEDKFGRLEFFETTEAVEVNAEKSKMASPKKRKAKYAKTVSEKKVELFPDALKDGDILTENRSLEMSSVKLAEDSKEDIIVEKDIQEIVEVKLMKEEMKQNLNEQGGGKADEELRVISPLRRSWTRDEDKVILEAFRKEIDTEHTFSKISSSLPSRSVEDIQSRFRDLMILLERITSGTPEN